MPSPENHRPTLLRRCFLQHEVVPYASDANLVRLQLHTVKVPSRYPGPTKSQISLVIFSLEVLR